MWQTLLSSGTPSRNDASAVRGLLLCCTSWHRLTPHTSYWFIFGRSGTGSVSSENTGMLQCCTLPCSPAQSRLSLGLSSTASQGNTHSAFQNFLCWTWKAQWIFTPWRSSENFGNVLTYIFFSLQLALLLVGYLFTESTWPLIYSLLALPL